MIRLFTLCLAFLVAALPAAAFETKARAAYVIDQTTGTVLLNKNADEPLPPASMSKLMTLYMAFEAIKNGQLRLEDELPVSAEAAAYGGSTMFLQEGERVSVEDLLRGIIVLSGNDACVVIAEALSGTESKFALDMTMRAQQLGMTNSTFRNSNGWPVPGHRMSMRDLGLLANLLITEYPSFYTMFAEEEFLFDEKESANRFNRNPLLGLGIGADGLKTGHTTEAGYGLVGSAKQGNRRVIFALTGLDSADARARESEAIVNWAFRQFAMREIGKAGTVMADVPIAMSDAETVGVALTEDLSFLAPTGIGTEVTAEVIYNGPRKAPIAQIADEEELRKNGPFAELVISRTDLEDIRVPLRPSADVPPPSFLVRLRAATLHLFDQLNNGPQGAS